MTELHRVSVMDLTMAQVEAIELDPKVGKPMTEWGDIPSLAALSALVLAAGNGVPVDQVKQRTMRELLDLVDMGTDPTPEPESPS